MIATERVPEEGIDSTCVDRVARNELLTSENASLEEVLRQNSILNEEVAHVKGNSLVLN